MTLPWITGTTTLGGDNVGVPDNPYYVNDNDDLGITHEYGEDTAQDVISTFPGIGGGDGQPRTVTVRKPRP